MTGALIILAVTIVTGFVLYIIHRCTSKPGEESSINEPQRPEGCCGQHAICEKESLLQGLSSKIEYYDDEELDQYKGFDADAYSENQIEQFRDVLYTLRNDEIAGWARSMQMRGITLPTPIHDELLMLASEARQQIAPDRAN